MKIKGRTLEQLIDYRKDVFNNLLRDRVTQYVAGSQTYLYLRQFHAKFIQKAHDEASILYNYLYWTSNIERKIALERELEVHGVGSSKQLTKVLFLLLKRRDQMVKRLFLECDPIVKDVYLVEDNLLEILLGDGSFPIYCRMNELKKVYNKVFKTKESINPYYLSYISYTPEENN